MAIMVDSSQWAGEPDDTPLPVSLSVLGLLAPDAETRARAEAALREAGARRILVQKTRAV